MGDAEAPEGALELAERIAVLVAGAWPKEAQAVGINDFGKAPFSEGFPEVLEMVLGRIGSHEAAREVIEFVGDELVVGRVLQRQKILQKRFGFWWPFSASIPATGGRLEALAPLQEVGSKLVEPGTAHPEMRGWSGRVKRTCVEVVEDAPDESEGLAVN